MSKGLIIGLVLIVIIFIFGSCFVSSYNKPVIMEENVRKAWGDVENVLQRRYDLIPNLVATVKGYAKHEEGIFTDLAKARQAYFSAPTPNEKIAAAQGLEGALSRLLVFSENYPDLKANESFNKLMDELSGTENRISVERRRYNGEVELFRQYARAFPNSFFVSLRGININQYDYFKADESAKQAPKVEF